MNKLDEIMAYKRQEIQALLPNLSKLKAAALQRNDFAGFRTALDQGPDRLGIIAEVKKASPSAGVIDPDFDHLRQAHRYFDGGAHCLSVLTDQPYFQGHLSFLADISKVSPVPLLRKDFMVHEAQIYEALIAGADAILLIVAGLDDEDLKRLYHTARDFQLDVLVEVHDLREMDRALELELVDLIGINNRNLQTFQTDLATTAQLAEEVPEEVLLVSESGIKTTTDGQTALAAGANALLIGETLMRAHNVAEELIAYRNITLPETAQN